MKAAQEERKERSLKVLKTVFAPIVHRKIHRKHQARALEHALTTVTSPNEEALRVIPLLRQWPETIVRRLLKASRLVYCERGTVLALQGEPLETADILWVLSGKLTDLPTKNELVKCAQNTVGVADIAGTRRTVREGLSGPVALPQLFDSDGSQKRIPLNVVQEMVLDRLETYAAGHIAASDGVILRMRRERSIRCVTPVVACLIPLKAFNKEVGFLSKAVRRATFDVAKSSVHYHLMKRDDKPSIESLLLQNSILTKVNGLSLRQVWTQLQPKVFMPNEIICPNAYISDEIFFIRRGVVKLQRKKESRALDKPGAAVGLNSFISYIMPHALNETLTAVSETYCELWSISFEKVFTQLGGDYSALVAAATKYLHFSADKLHIIGRIRPVPVFTNLQELCLHQISHSMQLRVHAPGQCILHSNRIIREGLILVVGQAYQAVMDKTKRRKEPMKCGVPYFFCEAITKKVIPTAVFTETSVIALHSSPESMLDALEDNGCTPQEIELFYDRAAKYIVDTYGPVEKRIEAQLRAASRVREHNLELRPPKPKPSSIAMLEAVKEEMCQVRNEVVSTLVARLQALHRDPLDLLRHQYLTDFQGVMGPSTAEWEEQEKKERPSPMNGSYFTIDERGEVVVKEPDEVVQELVKEEVARMSPGLSMGPSLSTSLGLESIISRSKTAFQIFTPSHSVGVGEDVPCGTPPLSSILKKELDATDPLAVETPREVVLLSPTPRPPQEARSDGTPAPRPVQELASVLHHSRMHAFPPIKKHSISQIIHHFDDRCDHQKLGVHKYDTDLARSSVAQSKKTRLRDFSVPVRRSAAAPARSGLLCGIVDGQRERVLPPPQTFPPRQAAIQHTIGNLKDDAVGFDARAEYRRYLLRKPHSKY